LIHILQTRYVTSAIATTPPITAPAIAPTFGLLLVEEEVDVVEGVAEEACWTHVVEAHELQVGAIKEQV
jgi:hypothetical protein